MQFISTVSKRTIIARFDVSAKVSGAVFGGHLLEGTVAYPVVEVYMQECDAEIIRTFDPQTKFWPMKF